MVVSEMSSMAAQILTPVLRFNDFFGTAVVHPQYFPFPVILTYHAARASHAYRCALNQGTPHQRQKITWLQDIAGYLVLVWGASFVCSYAVNLTPEQLLTPWPLLHYVSIHLVVTLFHYLGIVPSNFFLDTLLPLADASSCAHALAFGMELATHHPTNAAVRESLFTQLLLGSFLAAGGVEIAGMLGVVDPSGWSFRAPPLLHAVSPLHAIDTLSIQVGTLLYSFLAGTHPAWNPYLETIRGYHFFKGQNAPTFALMSSAEALALITLFISFAFVSIALRTHWWTWLAPQNKHANGTVSTMPRNTKVSGPKAIRTKQNRRK